MMVIARPKVWTRLRNAHVPQLLGVYVGVAFAALQGVDMFVERLGLPDWAFGGALLLTAVGLPVVAVTAVVQHSRDTDVRRPAGDEPTAARASEEDSNRSAPAEPRLAHLRRWFTWRNAAVTGAGSFLLLIMLVTLYMAMRVLGVGPVGSLMAAGVLDARERVLLADFQSQTGNAALAGAVTEAFRIDFEQSPAVTVVDPGVVHDGLVRMQREADAALDVESAHELALREGIKAVLAGELNTAGRSFVVSVRLLSTGTGEPLVSLRETARDSSSLIGAVDELSGRLRERIGESLRTIRGDEPLERVSTASLPALRMYSQAVRALEVEGDHERGIALLEDAVALDSTFAMAWRKLGVALTNRGAERERAQHALTRAFENADRLTDRERHHTRGMYYATVQADADRAIASYRAVLDIYPDDGTALNNLARLYDERGNYADAAALYRRALTLDSTRVLYYTNLAIAQVAMGEWDAAEATLARFAARFPDHWRRHSFGAALAAARGQYDSAAMKLRRLRENRIEPVARPYADESLGSLALLHGRITEARRAYDDIWAEFEQMGWPDAALQRVSKGARIDFELLDDTAGAARRLNAMLAARPLTATDAEAGLHLQIASHFALMRMPVRARQLVADWDSAPLDESARRRLRVQRADVETFITAAEGRHDVAVRQLRKRAETSACRICYFAVLARLHDRAGQPDSAIAYYKRYIETPWLFRLDQDAFALAPAHERLGQLYDALGEAAPAATHLARFAALWADPDPALRRRVEAALRRLGELTAESR